MALFGDLAGAALRSGFDKWLRTRFGPTAKVGSVKPDGTRIVVGDARLPLGRGEAGSRIRLYITTATVTFEPRALSAPTVAVTHAVGRIVIRGGNREIAADLELRNGHADSKSWLCGELHVRNARCTPIASDAKAAAATTAPMGAAVLAGQLDVAVSSHHWSLRGNLSEGGAEQNVAVEGSLGADPVTHLRIDLRDAAYGWLIDHASAWLDVSPSEVALAPSARGTGDVTWRRGKLTSATVWRGVAVDGQAVPGEWTVSAALSFEAATTGEVTFNNGDSNIHIDAIDYQRGHLERAHITGEIALSDIRSIREAWHPIGPSSRGAIRVDGHVSTDASTWKIAGEVTAEVLELELARPHRARLALESVRGEVALDSSGGRRVDFSAEGYGTQFHGHAAITEDGPTVVVQFADATVALPLALSALIDTEPLGRDDGGPRPHGSRWLPDDLRVSGRFSLETTAIIRGELALETERTALLIPLTFTPTANAGKLDGSQIRGRVDVADLSRLGWFDGTPSELRNAEGTELRVTGVCNVRFDVSGSPKQPELRGQIDCPALTIEPAGWPLTDVAAELLVDHESVLVRHGVGRTHGGRLSAEVVVGRTETFRGVDLQAECKGIRVEDISIDGRRWDAHIAGRLSGKLHWRRQSTEQTITKGHGTLTLDEPHYPALHLARAPLADVGLPVPDIAGTTPLTAAFDITDDAVTVGDVQLSVAGIDLRGSGVIHRDRALTADAVARLHRSYLQRSALLVLPASLAGGITVPLRLEGSIEAPRIRADIRAALSEKIGMKEISSAVTGAFDELRQAADGAASAIDSLFSSFASPSASAPAPSPGDDRELADIVERCLADDPDSDALIDRLIDAGVSSDDIVRILEKRRMRF